MSKMTFEEFSVTLIETGDLDPDYIFVYNVCKAWGWDEEKIEWWITHKAVLANASSELEVMLGYTKIEDAKHAAERGKSKKTQKGKFWNLWGYRNAIGGYKNLPINIAVALERLQSVHEIGKRASWKILDLLECSAGQIRDWENIDFRVAYELPLQGLLMVNKMPEKVGILKSDRMYMDCMKRGKDLWGKAAEMKSKPREERIVGMAEFESCLCKYHGYHTGKYKVGGDAKNLHKAISESKFEDIRALINYTVDICGF